MSINLHFHLDSKSGIPVYRQMMDQIRYYVASGKLKPGDQLPSIRELAQSLTVNPTTVVKAYNELSHEGVIELQRGKGAFVSQSEPAFSFSEQEKVIRRLARQLAVETAQMGVSPDRVLAIVNDELDTVRPAENIASMPAQPRHREASNQ